MLFLQCPQGKPSPSAGCFVTGAPQLAQRLMGVAGWLSWGLVMAFQKNPLIGGLGYVAICRCIRRAIQAATGTAHELPSARYLGPSGHSLAGLLRHGIAV